MFPILPGQINGILSSVGLWLLTPEEAVSMFPASESSLGRLGITEVHTEL